MCIRDRCYIKADDEELYENLFKKVGETNLKIWERFMKEFGDIYCVLRFGDDLGSVSYTHLFQTVQSKKAACHLR